MKRLFRLVGLVWLAGLVALSAQAGELYRWVGANGKVSYGDTPPAGAALVESMSFFDEAAADAGLPYETRRAMKNFPATLYVIDDCPAVCDDARNLLNKRGVPFSEKPIRTQAEFDAYKVASGSENVPALLIGKTFAIGFNAVQWNNELDNAGYPKYAPERHQVAPPKPAPAAASGVAPAGTVAP